MQVPSPVVGIRMKDTRRLQKQVEDFLLEIVQSGFKGFPEQCFQAPDTKIHRDLLNIIHHFSERDVPRSNRCSPVRKCLQLVVINFAMTHAWTIDEPRRAWVECLLQYQPDEPYMTQTSPRLLNRELKSYISELQGNLIAQILDDFSKGIKLSTSESLWASLIIQLLVLAMTAESLQVSRLCKEETEKREQATLAGNATIDVHKIEDLMDYLLRLFCAKYPKEKKSGRTFRPVASEADRRLLLDPNHRDFAVGLTQVVTRHGQYICSGEDNVSNLHH